MHLESTENIPNLHTAEKQAQVSSTRASLSFCWNYSYDMFTLQINYYQVKGKRLTKCVCMFSRD